MHLSRIMHYFDLKIVSETTKAFTLELCTYVLDRKTGPMTPRYIKAELYPFSTLNFGESLCATSYIRNCSNYCYETLRRVVYQAP